MYPDDQIMDKQEARDYINKWIDRFDESIIYTIFHPDDELEMITIMPRNKS